MNKKAVIYFASAFIMITSVSAYFILKEINMPENTYVTSGKYDIWETENSAGDPSNNIGIIDEKTDVPAAEDDHGIHLDLNSASKEDFMKLKGIGNVISGNIISYRQNAGGFKSIEEIMNVKGIGEKTFLAIKEHIYVEKSDGSSSASGEQRSDISGTASDK